MLFNGVHGGFKWGQCGSGGGDTRFKVKGIMGVQRGGVAMEGIQEGLVAGGVLGGNLGGGSRAACPLPWRRGTIRWLRPARCLRRPLCVTC